MHVHTFIIILIVWSYLLPLLKFSTSILAHEYNFYVVKTSLSVVSCSKVGCYRLENINN